VPSTRHMWSVVDREDAAQAFERLWHIHTSGSKVYLRALTTSGNLYLHHQIAGEPPSGLEVDHRSGNSLCNVRRNLRWSTRSQNCANSRRRHSKSPFRGIYLVNNKWQAQIRVDRHMRYLGSFRDAADAARAYDRAALDAFGEFATLNFPSSRRSA
jgi:HNH endonuclease